MARYAPPDYRAGDPTVYGNYDDGGNGGGQEPELDEPIPGWRKPIALVGWGVLTTVLIELIIYGIIQLAHGSSTQEPATTTTTTATTPPSSAAPVVPPTHHRPHEETTTTTTPTTDTGTPTMSKETGTPTTNPPSRGAFPRLPSVITLPSLPGLPGLPTVITLPPRL